MTELSSHIDDLVIGKIFFFNDTATTEIYTLSLHDALPISRSKMIREETRSCTPSCTRTTTQRRCCERRRQGRSEEHTSELQSRQYPVCRLLLVKIIWSLVKY